MTKNLVFDGSETQVSDEMRYLTIREVARRLRFSVDTLRRHLIAGKLDEIVWHDFLKNGKFRATVESVEAFEKNRRIATQKPSPSRNEKQGVRSNDPNH